MIQKEIFIGFVKICKLEIPVQRIIQSQEQSSFMDISSSLILKIEMICVCLKRLTTKKAPQLGIEPRFSDLKSDVLTVERLRLIQSFQRNSIYIGSKIQKIRMVFMLEKNDLSDITNYLRKMLRKIKLGLAFFYCKRRIYKIEQKGNQGSKVPMDFRGSFPVSRPRASFNLLARNSVFLVKSAYPLIPVSQVTFATSIQLQIPSQQPMQQRRQPKIQYLKHFAHPSIALPKSPNLQSINNGAHHAQQQESQNKQAN